MDDVSNTSQMNLIIKYNVWRNYIKKVYWTLLFLILFYILILIVRTPRVHLTFFFLMEEAFEKYY